MDSRHYRHWTRGDDQRLRSLWEGNGSLEAIAKRLGRTVATTYWRAQLLGLPLGVPDGFEYLHAAAVRAGYTTSQLRRILAAASIGLHPVRGRPTGSRRKYHYVDPFDVDRAVEVWCASEPVESAARARGLIGEVLRRWLLAAGHQSPRKRRVHWRVATTVIDQVVTEQRQLVSLCAAAPALGLSRQTLAARLRRAGVEPRGRRWRLAIEDVRQLVAGAPRAARLTSPNFEGA